MEKIEGEHHRSVACILMIPTHQLYYRLIEEWKLIIYCHSPNLQDLKLDLMHISWTHNQRYTSQVHECNAYVIKSDHCLFGTE